MKAHEGSYVNKTNEMPVLIGGAEAEGGRGESQGFIVC